MIVRMKEILLFTSASSVDETILQLGQLGAVDIVELNGTENGTAARRMQAVQRAESALAILKNHISQYTGPERDRYVTNDPKQLVDRVLQTGEISEKGQEILAGLKRQKAWYETWGENVKAKEITDLKAHGIYLRLYLMDQSEVDSLRDQYTIVELPERHGKVPVVLIARSDSEQLDRKEVPLPHLSLKDIEQQMERKQRQMRALSDFLTDQANCYSWLEEYHILLKDQLGMQQALEGMGDIEGKLKYLKGYIPRDSVEDFVRMAQVNHWGYQISEPDKLEEVPVYIKNPKWISIINPVMKFIDIVPGYREVDVSIYFLVAFALFFAMLVGDAGYGLVFLLVAYIFRKKMTSQMRILIYVLSVATIIWGVLSGTYFGAEKIAALPFLNTLILPDIASFGVDNISFMMHLSFLIGAIHLTIAHGIRMVRFINSTRALSEVGWVALVWGLYFLTEQLVLGKPMPDWLHLAVFRRGSPGSPLLYGEQ